MDQLQEPYGSCSHCVAADFILSLIAETSKANDQGDLWIEAGAINGTREIKYFGNK